MYWALFILCYKFIHSLLERGTPESVAQLAAKVADLQQRKGYQQLAELEAGKFTRFIKRGISSGADIVKHTVNTASGTVEPLPVNSEQQRVNGERQTEPSSVNSAIYTEPIPLHREQGTGRSIAGGQSENQLIADRREDQHK